MAPGLWCRIQPRGLGSTTASSAAPAGRPVEDLERMHGEASSLYAAWMLIHVAASLLMTFAGMATVTFLGG